MDLFTYPVNRFTEFIEIRSERAVKGLVCIRPQNVPCDPYAFTRFDVIQYCSLSIICISSFPRHSKLDIHQREPPLSLCITVCGTPYNHISRLTKRWEPLTIKCLLATSQPCIASTKQNFPLEKKNPELIYKLAVHPLLHSAINKKNLFGSKLDLNLRGGGGGLMKCYVSSIILHGDKKLGHFGK